MSLYLYDEAFNKYLLDAMSFANIVNADESESFNVSADKHENIDTEIQLPMISFWRVSNPLNSIGIGNFSERLYGRTMSKNLVDFESINYRSIPIDLNYQLTIWSDSRHQVDDIFRELIMYISTDNPVLSLYLPDIEPEFLEDEYLDFNLRLLDVDTTIDTSKFVNQGRIYKQHLIITVDEARLFFARTAKLVKNNPVNVELDI